MDKIRGKNAQKIVVAMSGGVDSSAAAALLKKAGFDVIGVFMKFWAAPHHFDGTSEATLKSSTNRTLNDKLALYQSGGEWNRCCSPEAETRARKVAKILKIPFYVFNFEKEFKKRIVDYFLQGYKKGITPNPCVVCNKEIKFGLLLEKALALGADYVATGHYVRKKKKGAKLLLLKAKDKAKDQSYFLWQLNQKQLKRILFPIGDYTKEQVRKLAKKFKLPVLNIHESMEICFIPDKLEDFLKRHIKTKPGLILTTEGKKIGEHQGLPFYTIGQRKGIELPGGPYYVVKKDKKKNVLIVASVLKDESLWSKTLTVENINWISGKAPKLPLKIKAQIRYRHQPALATISRNLAKTYSLKFKAGQRAITPGQSAVFYKGDELLGGGIIS